MSVSFRTSILIVTETKIIRLYSITFEMYRILAPHPHPQSTYCVFISAWWPPYFSLSQTLRITSPAAAHVLSSLLLNCPPHSDSNGNSWAVTRRGQCRSCRAFCETMKFDLDVSPSPVIQALVLSCVRQLERPSASLLEYIRIVTLGYFTTTVL